MDMQERTLVPVELASLPGEIRVPGFAERYGLHQLRNHESALLVLVRLAGYGLIGVGVLLVLFAPKSLMVHALYGPTLMQKLLLTPELPLILGVLTVAGARFLGRGLDRTPLPVLEFFDKHYLLKLDQAPAPGQQVQIRYCNDDLFALSLLTPALEEQLAPQPD